MPERVKLTKTRVDRAEYPHEVDDARNAPRVVLWDDDEPGFGLRLYPSGRKVFVAAMKVRGRQRWVTLGEPGAMVYDDAKDEPVPLTVTNARKLAARHRALADAGKDPVEERRRQRAKGTTVAELADAYMQETEPTLKPSTRDSYKDYIRHVKGAFGKRQPDAITEQDVRRWFAKMAGEPTGANRRVWMMSKLMDEAAHRGLRTAPNPCSRIKRYKEKARTRFLSPAELARVGDAIQKLEGEGIVFAGDTRPKTISKPAAAALRLLLFTGARKGEVLTMEWGHVDFERGLWDLPDAKAGARAVYLNAPALAVLDSLKQDRDEDNPYVIAGQKKGQPLTTLQKPWLLVRHAADVEDVRLHDLRHAHGAMSASGGDSLLVVGALLGHKQASTTERYAHLADDAVRAASERVGAAMATALNGGEDGEVVELDKARKR